MAELTDDLGAWLTPLISRLEPAAQNQLARELAKALRRSQQQRISAQQNPDGSPYTPRKPRELRGKTGRIKRRAKMFRKLRTARYLKAQGQHGAASVGFIGRITRIARVHQYGLRDRAEPRAPDTQYAQRELLGLTPAEQTFIRDQVIAHLSP
jgi:phage virion morphogenesis protein